MKDRGEVARIASDPVALEAFYRQHFEAVSRFVARRVADPHLAADLIAETFLAAMSSAASYRPEQGDPLPWLYGVARNVVATEARHSARDTRAAHRFCGRALLDRDDIAELIERIDAEAESRRLYQAMGEVSDHDRRLLELVAVDGLTVHDAAKILGLSQVTARVRLHRARRFLQQRVPRPFLVEALGQKTAVEEA